MAGVVEAHSAILRGTKHSLPYSGLRHSRAGRLRRVQGPIQGRTPDRSNHSRNTADPFCSSQVEYVPDEDVDLQMDTHFINLEELWPTVRQENSALNVDKTAEGLDNYRFFLNNIWQPWDADYDDESIDFIETHFLSRAQLYCDMKNKRMSRNSIARLKLLINEARDISLKRNRLENEFMSDDEEEDEDEGDVDVAMKMGEPSQKKKDLLRFNIRMNQIKTEFEILENPKMRKVFEESQQEMQGKKVMQVNKVIVMKPGTVQEQIDYLTAIKSELGKDENTVVRSSLQDALLNATSASDLIFIPHSIQAINYPLAMEDGGCIKAIRDDQLKAIIACKEEDQHLFVCGNYQFENLTLDCRNVDIGLLVRPKATVTMKNCVIIGGKQSSTNQGICVREAGKLILDNCRFEDHSTGVSVRMGSEVFLKNCSFANCTTGLDLSDSCEVSLDGVIFDEQEGRFGVIMETDKVPEGKVKETYKDFQELPR